MAEINFDTQGAVQAYYQARDLWLAEKGKKPLGVIAAEIDKIISPFIYNDPQGGGYTMANNMDTANIAANVARHMAASTGMSLEEVMSQTGSMEQGSLTFKDTVNSGSTPSARLIQPSLQHKTEGRPWYQGVMAVALPLAMMAGAGALGSIGAAPAAAGGTAGGTAAATTAMEATAWAAAMEGGTMGSLGALGGAGSAGAGAAGLGMSAAGGGTGVAAGGVSGAGTAGGAGALGGGGAVAGTTTGTSAGGSVLSKFLVPAATSLISAGVNAYMSSKAADAQAKALMDSAGMSYDAAMAAIRAQVEGQESAIGYLREANAQARADVAPWLEAGKKALGTLEEKVAAGPGEFTTSPGYEFRMGEGLKAIESSAAARGTQLSGQTMKGMNNYAQNFATADYDNFLRRYYESLNPLESLAGVGQNMAAQTSGQAATMGGNLANLATGTASNIGNLGMAGARAMGTGISESGLARASGYINTANSITSPLNNLSNLYTQYQMLSQLQGA